MDEGGFWLRTFAWFSLRKVESLVTFILMGSWEYMTG